MDVNEPFLRTRSIYGFTSAKDYYIEIVVPMKCIGQHETISLRLFQHGLGVSGNRRRPATPRRGHRYVRIQYNYTSH